MEAVRETENEVIRTARSVMREKPIAAVLDAVPKLRKLLNYMIAELRRLLGEDQDDGQVFPVKLYGETMLFRCCDLLFFESEGRKVSLRTKAQELSFTASFEELQEKLPDYFFRCHRSFLINLRQVRGVNWRENVITLKDGSVLLFSRANREAFREALEAQTAGKDPLQEAI